MDNLTIERIKQLHPKIREEVLELYKKANNKLGKGLRLRFSYTLRTFKEQDELYAQGRTTPGKKVTDAKAGQSFHNYGLAFDIVLMYDKDGDGKFEEVSWDTKRDGDKDGISDWLEVTQVFTNAGYSNGFIKNGKKWDLPHFQKDFGFKPSQLKSMIETGKYTLENNVKYVKI